MAIGENLLADADVCVPGTALDIPEPVDGTVPAQLKALSDPTRLRIVQILAANGSVCACDLEQPLGLSQPTVSHHLRQLVDAGILDRNKQGTWAFFSVSADALQSLSAILGDLRR